MAYADLGAQGKMEMRIFGPPSSSIVYIGSLKMISLHKSPPDKLDIL